MLKKLLLVLVILSCIVVYSCAKKDTVKEEREYTIFGMFNKMIFNETWSIFTKSKEMTGVTLKSAISQNATDEKEAFNLMLASGNLPDIIRYYNPKELETLGKDGGLAPLQDLIKEHAPNITKFFSDNPKLKREAVSVDGNIYYIPYYTDVSKNKAGPIWFIRKDWLDKLDLPIPVTIDDLYNTMVAFKTKDPNGNGKADEVPFFNRINNITQSFEVLYDMMQVRYPWYLTDKAVEFSPSTEKFKESTKILAKWYKEGLIDREYFTRDIKTVREYFFGNNIGAVTIDWASTASYANTYKDKIQDFELAVIAPPEINGKSKMVRPRQPSFGGWGISSATKDPVGVIKYFDFWFSPEGKRLWNFGIEGEHYTLVNDEPVFTDLVTKNPDGKSPLQVLYSIGAQWEMGVHQDYSYEEQLSLPVVMEGYKMYADKKILEDIILMDSLKYTPEELKEFVKIDSQITSYSDEMSQKWVMGASDIDKDWDNYIKRLNNLGLQRAIEIQKKAVERFIK